MSEKLSNLSYRDTRDYQAIHFDGSLEMVEELGAKKNFFKNDDYKTIQYENEKPIKVDKDTLSWNWSDGTGKSFELFAGAVIVFTEGFPAQVMSEKSFKKYFKF